MCFYTLSWDKVHGHICFPRQNVVFSYPYYCQSPLILHTKYYKGKTFILHDYVSFIQPVYIE